MTAALTPSRFKVIRTCTGALLAEGSSARETIDVLEQIESIFDVLVYVWHPVADTWRPLTPGEQRMLWDFRAR